MIAAVFLSQQTIRFLILGLATGSMYALVGLGIVLVYRSSGVLNFSAGGLGAVSAYLFYNLRDNRGFNWILALAISLTLGALLGALAQLILMRFLGKSSLLARLIATLGLMATFEGFADIVWSDQRGAPNALLPSNLVKITSQLQVPESRLILIGIVIVAGTGLRLIYSKTLFGLATSAVAENPLVASTSGWSPHSVELINFTLAGLLSAFAAIMLAPILTLSASVLTIAILPALAAALVGGFGSFSITVAAALVIGGAQSELSFFLPNIASGLGVQTTSLTGIDQVVPLVVVLVLLVAKGRARPSRGEVSAKLPLPGRGIVRPVPLTVGCVIALLLVLSASPDWEAALTTTFAFGILVLSVVVVTGLCGQLSLCQFALSGFGCWVAARLMATHGLPFPLAFLAGVGATVLLGALLAIPAMRTRGVNLAVATLAMAMVVSAVVFANGPLTGGFAGTKVESISLFGWNIDPISHPAAYGGVALGAFVVVGLVVANIRRGETGRRLLAIRSNERAAASLGIGIYTGKVFAFAVGGAIAAVAGIILGFQNQYVQFGSFDITGSINAILYSVVGGVGWTSGSVISAPLGNGGVVGKLITDFFHNVDNIGFWLALAAGVNVVVILRQAPDGLASLYARVGDHLPSFLAIGFRQGSASRVLDGRASEPVALEVESITVRFGGVVALDQVSLAVRPGQVVGLMGANGAGKTTLIDAVSGFADPVSGDIRYGDRRITDLSPERRARLGVARSWQAVELFEEMTVRENLLTALDSHSPRRYLTDLIHPGPPASSEVMNEVVTELGLDPYLDLRPSSLSQGARRLAGIARSIVSEPGLLLLDEPAAGLDPGETAELATQIRAVADRRGIGVLVVEHDVGLLMTCCDRIVALDFGRVIAEGTPTEVAQHPEVLRSYLGKEIEAENDASGELHGPPEEIEASPVRGGLLP
jgi:ABC-type branched-subunit amino acid transport system ATPase component/ABC-type branched-subunit amino acid transport system permease subunit